MSAILSLAAVCGAAFFATSCARNDRDTGEGSELVPESLDVQQQPDIWDQAAASGRRLSLSVFADLPDDARIGFEGFACLVPQVSEQGQAHNVVRGTFAAAGQFDWAALCSRNGQNVIVVAWGGPQQCASELAESSDRGVLQRVGEGRIGFSRLISAIDPQRITRYHEEYGGPAPPSPLTHQGIDDIFVGKGSVVRYCHEGEWLRLTGAD
jgi:hypothetical protein